MRKRYPIGSLAVASALAVGTGLALSGNGSSGPIVKTPGGASFKANQYVKDSVHFAPGTVTVVSGGTVTFVNTSKDEPHTVTISTKADLPHDFAHPCRPCRIASAHLKNPRKENSPIKTWVLNKGADGFDVEGDSVALAPKGIRSKTTVVISAPAGTTLYFMCAIHPWMQGKIVVR
jgi:plastocyanin